MRLTFRADRFVVFLKPRPWCRVGCADPKVGLCTLDGLEIVSGADWIFD